MGTVLKYLSQMEPRVEDEMESGVVTRVGNRGMRV